MSKSIDLGFLISFFLKFDLNVKKRTGRVAMLGGVTNDGQLNSTGKVISFTVQDKLAKKIENECGIDLIQFGEQKFPTFSVHEAKNAGFQRFDYELSLLDNRTECQLEIFDRFSKEFWYELHSRNEQMCNSEKPLELTLQSNLGKTTEQRLQKLIELRDLCFELYLKEWEGPIEIYGPLHYYKN